MKSEKKIFLAFMLNFCFSIFNFAGGIFTGSVAILSDAIHDLGDSLSIGTSFLFEKISKREPNEKYTYGYYRYSVLGSVVQTVILLCGSLLVSYNSILRLINPTPINYEGMIFIAIFGFSVNFAAAFFTSGGRSLNQRVINLHMLEDVMGWAIVLIGAIVMNFTDWVFLDPALSIMLAVFIMINALKSLQTVIDIFLEKTPRGIRIEEIRERLLSIDGVEDIHHIHMWSMDGYNNAATIHAVSDNDHHIIKEKIKEALKEYDVSHATIECEYIGERCDENCCRPIISEERGEHHHHHHHHHR